jgi:hypothetical protein
MINNPLIIPYFFGGRGNHCEAKVVYGPAREAMLAWRGEERVAAHLDKGNNSLIFRAIKKNCCQPEGIP